MAKGAARKAWVAKKVNGKLPQVLRAVEQQKTCDQWTKNGGEFIPYPASWINAERWEDVVEKKEEGYTPNPLDRYRTFTNGIPRDDDD